MKRVVTALLLIPSFVYLILWAPYWAFLAAVAGVSILCFREYANLVALHGLEKPRAFGYVAGVLILLLPWKDVAMIVLLAMIAMSLALRLPDLTKALPSAAALLLGVLYTFGSMRCAIDLRSIEPRWLFFGLSLNWAGDIAAYYVGKMIGRHRLAPEVSPAKTWEGSAGSVAASLIYAALFFPRLLPKVPLMEALALTAVANIAGQLGDLVESAMKRGAGVKDSGTLLPGHGGWLDRVDSGLFALPVVYFVVSNFGL
jgi:phosphatidate cytidylyltransferase